MSIWKKRIRGLACHESALKLESWCLSPPSFAHFLAVKCGTDGDRKGKEGEIERNIEREGGRLWIGRVSGMHGQPLCLSKTLQQLHARDKSNHSQSNPPSPHPLPFSSSYTPTHTPIASLSLYNVYMHTGLCAGSCKDAEISCGLYVASQSSFFLLFVWHQSTAGSNMDETEREGLVSLFILQRAIR